VTPILAVENLRVAFPSDRGEIVAVDGISFAVRPGEAFGIVGESGSGKSTVLRALSGLNERWSGRIRVDDAEVGPRRSKAFFKRVQMVFQDPYASLHPKQTVDTTLMEPLRIHGLDDRNGRVERALAAVGLGHQFRFRYPHQLSGGQRQRVAIARALILEPTMLLLDEPTSALDVSIQAEVLNLLCDLRERLKLTYVLVSHDLAVVAHMCDRLVVMQTGRIVEELAADALAAGRADHSYSQQLIEASRGYDRDFVSRLDAGEAG
jgi:ABC-type dipeptide/oligopeptide/nickel transport system ATPase subunit